MLVSFGQWGCANVQHQAKLDKTYMPKEDLRNQIEVQGYVIQPKTLPQKSADSPVASLSPIKIDPAETWTGIWLVDGGHLMGGVWAMKQSGAIVKSTDKRYYDFKGRVRGDQLEGAIKGDYDVYRKLLITLSSDGLTFEGKSLVVIWDGIA